MQEFFSMGGYALYVWSSFVFGIACIVYLYTSAKMSFNKKFKEVSIWQARQKKAKVKFS